MHILILTSSACIFYNNSFTSCWLSFLAMISFTLSKISAVRLNCGTLCVNVWRTVESWTFTHQPERLWKDSRTIQCFLYLFSSVHLFACREFFQRTSHSPLQTNETETWQDVQVKSVDEWKLKRFIANWFTTGVMLCDRACKPVCDRRSCPLGCSSIQVWAESQNHSRWHLSNVFVSQSQPQVVILIQHDLLQPLLSHPTGLKADRESNRALQTVSKRGRLLFAKANTKMCHCEWNFSPMQIDTQNECFVEEWS